MTSAEEFDEWFSTIKGARDVGQYDQLQRAWNAARQQLPVATPADLRLAIKQDSGGDAQVYVPDGQPLPAGYRWF